MNIANILSKGKPTKSVIDIGNVDNKRILFALYGGIGDDLLMTPLFRWIKRTFKNTFIEFAVRPDCIPLFKNDKNIDFVSNFVEYKKDPNQFRHFDYHFNFETSINGNKEAEEMHAIDAYFRLITKDLDLSTLSKEDKFPNIELDPFVKQETKRRIEMLGLKKKKLIGFQLQTSSHVRNWGYENNRKLVKLLTDNDYNVILFDYNTQLSFDGNGVFHVWDYCGKDIVSVMAWASICDVLVGPDSMLMQVAQAFDIPCVGIYGAFPAKYRMGYYDKGIGIECDREKIQCSPCFLHKSRCPHGLPSPCMESINPEFVKYAVDHVINNKIDSFPKKSAFPKNIFYLPFITQEDLEISDKQIERQRIIATDFTYAVEKYIPGTGQCKIADMGAGNGTLIHELKRLKNNYLIYGVDISLKAHWKAMEAYGYNVETKDICHEYIWKENQLNAIIMNRVFEYDEFHKWQKVLPKVKYYLFPKGIFYIITKKEIDYEFAQLINEWNFEILEQDKISIDSDIYYELILRVNK